MRSATICLQGVRPASIPAVTDRRPLLFRRAKRSFVAFRRPPSARVCFSATWLQSLCPSLTFMQSFALCVGGVITAALVLWLKFAYCDISLLLAHRVSTKKPAFFLNKVVWITGASQGLGKHLALYFFKNGAKLILSSRNPSKLQGVAEKYDCPERVHMLPFDLRSANWNEIASAGMSSFPEGVDYVIHNAGMSQHASALQTKADTVDSLFQLNTVGPIALTQALLPKMLEKGKGHFVVISSMAGKVPSPGQAIYAASKFALMGYYQTLRSELARSPIHVSICCPGPFNQGDTLVVREVLRKDGFVKTETKRSMGLDVQIVVQLIALAMQNRLSEVWIAKQPILLMAYLCQYTPSLATLLLDRVGPARAAAVDSGNGYSMKKIFAEEKTP